MKKHFYTIIIFASLYSCASIAIKSISTSEDRVAIFNEKYSFNPDTSFVIGKDKILFLKKLEPQISSQEDTFKLYIFERLENEWQIIRDTVFLFGYDYTILKSEIVSINGKDYLYNMEYLSGGSMGNFDIEYALYDVANIEKYFIHYTELPEFGKLLKDITTSKNLTSNQNLFNYLQDKLKNFKEEDIKGL